MVVGPVGLLGPVALIDLRQPVLDADELRDQRGLHGVSPAGDVGLDLVGEPVEDAPHHELLLGGQVAARAVRDRREAPANGVERCLPAFVPAQQLEVVGVETEREADGLARSSRNRFLAPDDRRRAAALSRALRAAQANGPAGLTTARAAADAELLAERIQPDYLEIRTPDLAVVDPAYIDP